MKSTTKRGPAVKRMQLLRMRESMEKTDRAVIEEILFLEGISVMALENGDYLQVPP